MAHHFPLLRDSSIYSNENILLNELEMIVVLTLEEEFSCFASVFATLRLMF